MKASRSAVRKCWPGADFPPWSAFPVRAASPRCVKTACALTAAQAPLGCARATQNASTWTAQSASGSPRDVPMTPPPPRVENGNGAPQRGRRGSPDCSSTACASRRRLLPKASRASLPASARIARRKCANRAWLPPQSAARFADGETASGHCPRQNGSPSGARRLIVRCAASAMSFARRIHR